MPVSSREPAAAAKRRGKPVVDGVAMDPIECGVLIYVSVKEA